MKKLFIIAAAACVALASCVKNEPVVAPEFGDEIAFDDPVMTPSVKAGIEEKTAFVAGDKFKTLAWWTADNTFAATNKYMPNAFDVTRGASAWSYEGIYYWPKSGYLHFSAFSPATVTGTFDEGGVIFTDYTVDADVTKQIDLLYSDRKTTQKVDPVQIVFNHALSAINFTVTKGSETPVFVLNGISIAEIADKGNFDQNLDLGNDKQAWVATGSETYSVDLDANITLDNTLKYAHTGLSTQPTTAALMLIPQSVQGKIVTLNYTMDTLPQTSQFILSGTWDPGYRYTYNISFSVEGIQFTASIDPWVDGEASGALQ